MFDSEIEEILRRVDPPSVANYAMHSGWDEVDTTESDRPVRILRNDEGREVWIPTDEQVIDYEERMEESITKISRNIGKSISDIANEMSYPPSDIIRLGVSNEETKKGIIPLNDGINLYRGSRDMLESVANSVEQPDLRYYRKSSNISEAYTERCKIGRSEVGSYVAKIISPFDFFDRQTDLFDDQTESFSRETAEKLMQSIRFLSEKLDNGDIDSVVNPEEGDVKVSANLCTSLSEMAPDTVGTGLEFNFDNTKTAPPPSEETPGSASLEQKHLPFLRKIADELEPSEELVESKFTGQVDSLRGRPDKEGRMQGLVRLSIFVEKYRGGVTASIRLRPDDYQTACDAHKTGETVQIEGTLRLKEEEDRIHQFESYDSFSVDT